jgi:hypothetical protein
MIERMTFGESLIEKEYLAFFLKYHYRILTPLQIRQATSAGECIPTYMYT